MAPLAPQIECKKLQQRERKNVYYSQMRLKSFEPNNFHMILRSHGKKRKTSITILPDEIIFNILILLPAEILYNVMRYVCRQWHTIIGDPRFVSSHLLLSTSTLLMYCWDMGLYHLLDVGECDIKLTGFKFDLHCRPMWSTCNGLVIALGTGYYIQNPIIRRTLYLPPLSLRVIPCICGLAFEASSKVYKVVVSYNDRINSQDSYYIHLGCEILTVGVDKAWRVLDCTHLTKSDKVFLLESPLACIGFMYWVSMSQLYILVLDLESERIKRVSIPFVYKVAAYFISKGKFITFWRVNSDFSMEVWLLKDHRTEEWVKYLYIDGEPIRNGVEQILSLNKVNPSPDHYKYICPTSWLGNGERVLFRTAFGFNAYLVYDFKTCGCWQVQMKNDYSCRLIPFVNTLAWV